MYPNNENQQQSYNKEYAETQQVIFYPDSQQSQQQSYYPNNQQPQQQGYYPYNQGMQQGYYYAPNMPVQSNGTSTVSLVFGILALAFIPFGVIFAIVALITGICSKKKTGFLNGKGKAGIITGSIALGLSVVIAVACIILINNNNKRPYAYSGRYATITTEVTTSKP